MIMKRVLFEFSKAFGTVKKGEVKRFDKPFAAALADQGYGFFVGDEVPTVKKPLEKKPVTKFKKK
jgi:hypothetical protein